MIRYLGDLSDDSEGSIEQALLRVVPDLGRGSEIIGRAL